MAIKVDSILIRILDFIDSGITYYYCIKSVDNSGNQSGFSNDQNEIPKSYSLSQNCPNPFNPSTTITYSLPNSNNVLLKIYDMLGNEVVNLVNDHKSAGKYKIEFNVNSLLYVEFWKLFPIKKIYFIEII